MTVHPTPDRGVPPILLAPAGVVFRLIQSPIWLITLLLVTLLAAGLTVLTVRTAEQHRITLLLLADTTAAVNSHSALEWQAIGGTRLSGELQAKIRDSLTTLHSLQARLGSIGQAEAGPRSLLRLSGGLFGSQVSRSGSVAPVEPLLRQFLRATDQEFALLARGDRAGAQAVDEAQVDPITGQLDRAIRQIRIQREGVAHRLLTLAVGTGVFTLLWSFLTVAVLARRFRQSRLRTEQLERERRNEREREERDSLTGLWNRRGLARLYQQWSAGGSMAVLTLDLNRLKAINDAGGHAAGDDYIRRVSRALLDAVRPHELVARWGGDEFVVLLPDMSGAAAHQVAAQVSTLLAAPGDLLPPFAYGVAPAPSGAPLEQVLTIADAAMYANKERQRQDLGLLGSDLRLGPTAEEFTERLEALDTPQAVLQEGLALARHLLEFNGSVYLERGAEGFVLRHLDGTLPAELRQELDGLVYHEGSRSGLTGRALAEGVTVWSNDYASEPVALAPWVASGLKSVIMVPVRHAGNIIGLIGLLQHGSWRVITPQVRRLMEAVARRLGHAVEQAQAVEAVRGALQGGLLALGVALEERDLETAGHTERVVQLSETVGRRLGLAETTLEALRQGASLHDIGKLAIPDAVLLKPGALTPEEWAVMQAHALRGYEIARRLSGLLTTTLDVIRSHHERWDGRGYPDGLVGEAIPQAARIFAVCDVYDALTHARPYKRAWSHQEALAEIQAQNGQHFDPAVVAAFLDVIATQAPPADQAVAANPT